MSLFSGSDKYTSCQRLHTPDSFLIDKKTKGSEHVISLLYSKAKETKMNLTDDGIDGREEAILFRRFL